MGPEFGVPLKDLQASILANFELKQARSGQNNFLKANSEFDTKLALIPRQAGPS